MTFPNRPNYRPGDKRRARKYYDDSEPAPRDSTTHAATTTAITATATTTVTTSNAGAKHPPHAPDDDALQAELLEVLSSMADGSGSDPAMAKPPLRSTDDRLKALHEFKTATESAQARLFADAHFDKLPMKHDLATFASMVENCSGGFQQALAESDPLEQLLHNMAADSGVAVAAPKPPTPAAAAAAASTAADRRWETLFQQIGPEHQHLLNGLHKLEPANAAAMPELDSAMQLIQEPSVRSKYQRAVHGAHEWGRHRLYQQLRSTATTRGFTRPVPTSPIESPLRQQPKKRTNLSKTAKTVLRDWFEAHLHHPYPTEDEKEQLGQQGGITIDQVNNWFINTRGRKWKPMLNRLMAQKKAGAECKLYDQMVKRIEEPYRRTSPQ